VGEISGLQLKRTGSVFYSVQWEEKPHPNPIKVTGSAAHLPTPPELAARLQPLMTELSIERGLDEYPTLNQAVDELSAVYIARALAALGWEFHAGCRIAAATLMEQAAPQHRRLLRRLLEILREDGVLRRAGDEWLVMDVPENMDDPQAAMNDLMEQYPAYRSQLRLLERCASQLAGVLSGQTDPLHVLFPGGSLVDMEDVYGETPYAQVYNTLIQESIRMALANLPRERHLRILEIGGGTGATTTYLTRILPPDRVEYVYTDVSPLFLEHARSKFQDFPSMHYRLLDIEREPAVQGFAPQSFDIVVAANVLHATADLRHTVEHVKSLIAPGGLLIVLEGIKPARWVDITLGMTEGWWKFTDTKLRVDYPLLSRWGWLDLLRSSGLYDATAVTNWDGVAGMGILLAHTSRMDAAMETAEMRAALDSDRTDWLIFADNKGYAEALINRLSARGEIGKVVLPSEKYQALHHSWTVNPASGDDLRRLVEEAHPQRGVVVIACQWSDETTLDSLKGEMNRYSAEVLHLAQALAASGQQSRLWLVTESAQPLKGTPDGFSLATMWGWGRVIALEHPEIWGGLIDIDMRDAPYVSAAEIFTEISYPDGEGETVWREGKRHIARLVPAPVAETKSALSLRHDASYLVTGSLDVGRWLVENGAGHVVLVGTNSESRAESSAQITFETADIHDVAQMRKIFARFGHGLPPLRGVIHAVAAQDAWPLKDMSLDSVKAAFAPKVMGTWVLHELTQNLPLDFFVLFSSAAALWGAANRGHDAAASAFMDSFAHYRRALGLPALSINWGEGMEMPPGQALTMLGDLMVNTDMPQIAIKSL
jgi:SAM-dependent methyltransferase